ncbi:sigma-70 family RNA polymerase sigma factor [Rossellomorea vietnamensis]|uniref:Sigma-70 family RNA polymerase sigma factor n=1 Tax=Rossellomorea vietnamensis TaxID=218284 RepID=A0A5D4NV13_9BACI|nr:sigma-70 family RNA polymerase sigma factor [Rossellomorea vietnamensis]TYS17770.1 sigma-70 family RNA polymerase sigma factor [Rossellomorea vietnamensis]
MNFEEIAVQYEPMIYKVMNTLHVYKNEDEFYQIGLIALWEAATRFNEEKGHFSSYAYSYIRGRFLDEMKRSILNEERHSSPKEVYWEYIEDPNEDVPLEAELLLSYCHELNDNQTKWVVYTCLDGLSIKEIAQVENVSPSAVKKWRSGAKEKIRKDLQNLY